MHSDVTYIVPPLITRNFLLTQENFRISVSSLCIYVRLFDCVAIQCRALAWASSALTNAYFDWRLPWQTLTEWPHCTALVHLNNLKISHILSRVRQHHTFAYQSTTRGSACWAWLRRDRWRSRPRGSATPTPCPPQLVGSASARVCRPTQTTCMPRMHALVCAFSGGWGWV